MRCFDFGKSLSDWGKKSTGIPNFYYLNEVDVLEELDSPIQKRDKRIEELMVKIILVGSGAPTG
jgi:hypothetical protein